MTTTPAATASPADVPAVVLQAEAQYLLGFPMIVAVTYDNTASQTQFVNLPELAFWTTRGAFSLKFDPVEGGAALETQSHRGDADDEGMVLDPGEAARMPLDLSNFAHGLKPGRHRITFTLYVGRRSRISRPVEVTFVAPSRAEAAEAGRLRRLAKPPTDVGAWAPFLTRNWNTVVSGAGLGAQAQRQLRLHLFLHRAFYGPQPPDQLDPRAAAAFDGPVLEPEGKLLELESVAARSAPAARRSATALVQKWPSLRRRTEVVLTGAGVLAEGRRAFGAEAERVKSPPTRPYAP